MLAFGPSSGPFYLLAPCTTARIHPESVGLCTFLLASLIWAMSQFGWHTACMYRQRDFGAGAVPHNLQTVKMVGESSDLGYTKGHGIWQL